MSDYISRQAAIDAILHNKEGYTNNFGDDPIDKYTIAIIDNDVQTLALLASVDVVPMGTYKQAAWERDMAIAQLKELGYGLGEKIRHGYWTLQNDADAKAYGWNICSECGVHVGEPTNFCPNCGTKMEL